VAILMKGRIREIGPVEQVRRWGETERRFRLDVSSWPPAASGPFRTVSDEPEGNLRRVVVALEGDGTLDDVLRAALAAGARVHGCQPIEPDLEEAFSRILADEEARAE
jgi:hypothetical protein